MMFGKTREWLGARVNKLVLLRSLSPEKDENGLPIPVKEKHWVRIHVHYFGDADSKFEWRHGHYPLRLSEKAYQSGSVGMFFSDVDTGDAIRFDGITREGVQKDEHDEKTAKQVMLEAGGYGTTISWWVVLLACALCVVGTIVIMNNIGSIMSLVGGNGTRTAGVVVGFLR